MKKGFLLIVCLFTFSAQADSIPVGSRFKRVIMVVLENASYFATSHQMYFQQLSAKGAVMANMWAEIHPSQGNYIAMVAGDSYGIDYDTDININVRHIGDLLEEAKKDWRVYAEDYPGDCFKGEDYKDYVRKHNPFISFVNVQNDRARCDKIKGGDAFDADYKNKALPEFSFYVPTLKNDGHDTGIDFSGNWVTTKFKKMLKDKNFMKDTLFVVTFDESQWLASDQIYTVFIGGNIVPGALSHQRLNHYNILSTIEQEFGLKSLGVKDRVSTPITGIWR